MGRQLTIRGSADSASIRYASYKGREHLVVPVIALLGDIVITPLGSTGPEFVPASVLAKVPSAWNGRPVLTNHPSFDGEGGGSANVPRVLEEMKVGEVFNTTFDGEKLRMEAWIDTVHALSLGTDGTALVSRCLGKEPVEVSVGCYVEIEERPGVSPRGAAYQYVWTDLAQDHLAMLPDGVTGACSVEAGCGAPRNAAEQKEVTMKENTADERPSVFARLLTALGITADDAQEVALAMQHKALAQPQEPVPAASTPDAAVLRAAECGCGKHNEEEKIKMSKVKELATRLIATKRFAEADRTALESLPEERLEAIAGENIVVEAAPVEKVEETVTVAAAKPKTEAEWLAEAPADVRALVERSKAQEASIRAALLKTLGDAQKVFTPAQLSAKPTDELRLLAKLTEAKTPDVDFTGLAADADVTERVAAEPPKGYSLALAKKSASATN